ncbi:toxin YhaV [Sphingobium wenxiniae]|jgi:toxin YhaV|uniref:Toxin YhaV n=1 Tax=Sphingobium wenxiniae (strain DSM 21828 / CGMCC 1.7748 / JZ-1) TaxID=595605 RepID=A0A562K842_SPHWJ|nr:type II toxin-antitoxin system YhaV family toxin [Sphingobium wenxiniae]MBB6193152.1 toxin YhaV [Sphingobium wenxiniae]MBE5074957.1 type II toxin-antitoxin system YhaV family toxin [Erythrobacteraceae bacterium E2-1 Yellow Sea]TWH91598.1 toxin YhaV [Sphingobium wenxiniae]
MTTVNGWTLYAHPLFLGQLERLIEVVAKKAKKGPKGYTASADAKLLAALRKLMFEVIPIDPARPEFRQGGTLGPDRKHWFRAKFGGGRFRLFFRYSSSAKIIIFAWVNDRVTLRTYGAKTDAYAVFASMLDKGNPPEDWTELMAASQELTSDQG